MKCQLFGNSEQLHQMVNHTIFSGNYPTLIDATIAKNYLTDKELDILNRIVSMYLDYAELQAIEEKTMTMKDWEERLNGFLRLWDREILKDNGKVSAELAKIHVETEFEKYSVVQDGLYKSDFDKLLEKVKE